MPIECVQTDNGTEFTNRFTSHRDKPTLFQSRLEQWWKSYVAPYIAQCHGACPRPSGSVFCQTRVVLTKSRPSGACPRPFESVFLSNAGGFDKIPAVSEPVRGLFTVFFVKRFYITPTKLRHFSIFDVTHVL